MKDLFSFFNLLSQPFVLRRQQVLDGLALGPGGGGAGVRVLHGPGQGPRRPRRLLHRGREGARGRPAVRASFMGKDGTVKSLKV